MYGGYATPHWVILYTHDSHTYYLCDTNSEMTALMWTQKKNKGFRFATQALALESIAKIKDIRDDKKMPLDTIQVQ